MRARHLTPLLVLLLCTCGPALFAQADTTTLAVQLDTICLEDEITARATGTYLWSTGATNASITPAASGPYAVTITDATGNVIIDPREVEVLTVPDPVFVTALTPPPYCPGQEVTFTVNLQGYDTLEWNDAQGTTFPGFGDNNEFVTIAAFPGAAITYVARYDRCGETLTALPPLQLTPEDFAAGFVAEVTGLPDTALCVGDTLRLEVIGEQISGVTWSDGNTSRTRSVVVELATELAVTVASPCDTTAMITLPLTVEDCTPPDPEPGDCTVLFPNVITPNGDGTNDRFRIFTDCPPAVYTLRIYNRWGQPVFTSTDATESWDGTRNGEPQNMDTYLYYAQYQLSPEEGPVEASGQFSLIR